MKRNKRKLKFSNFFHKRTHKNIKKHFEKKRWIFASTVLAGNLLFDVLFGNLVTNGMILKLKNIRMQHH